MAVYNCYMDYMTENMVAAVAMPQLNPLKAPLLILISTPPF